MSRVKALEELRGLGTRVKESCFTGVHCDVVLSFADEIEAEIAERFMERPCDADGVPIRVGDCLKYSDFYLKAAALTSERVYWWDENGECHWFKGSECRHAKPRTLEDVLRDVWKEALDYAKSDMWRNPDEVFAERADEIRELMGARNERA